MPRLFLAVLLTGCGPGEVDTEATSAASTALTEADTSTSASAGTEPTPTTGEPEPCGCADPQVVDGNLYVEDLTGFAGGCIGEVKGLLRITDVTDPSVLQPLVGLRRANLLQIYDNPGLVDLSVLACLEEVTDRLDVSRNAALIDVSALSRVRFARFVEFDDLPITALPSFAPDYHGFRSLDLSRLPELVDLAPVAGWPGLIEEYGAVGVSIIDVPKLKSVAELAGPIGPPTPDVKVVLELSDLPALTGLTGLEATRDGYLTLARLPQVTSLAPLAGLEQLDDLHLDGMTGLSSLEGLHNLRSAHDVRLTGMPGLSTLDGLRGLESAVRLQLGGCGEGEGLDGLHDLSGLDVLTSVVLWLSVIHNAGLVSLAGAPQLGEVGWVDLIENPKLTSEAVAAFNAEISASHLCFGGQIECGCLGALPAALDGCPAQWSGGSAVTVTGEGGPLDGTTAFFGWTHMSANYNDLNLVIVDASADIEAVKNDGLWQTSAGSFPKLIMENSINYQKVLGTHAGLVRLVQLGAETDVPVEITVTERLGDWTMIDPADPPRLAGEFTSLDPNAATIVAGPFDAVFCDAFDRVTSD